MVWNRFHRIRYNQEKIAQAASFCVRFSLTTTVRTGVRRYPIGSVREMHTTQRNDLWLYEERLSR